MFSAALEALRKHCRLYTLVSVMWDAVASYPKAKATLVPVTPPLLFANPTLVPHWTHLLQQQTGTDTDARARLLAGPQLYRTPTQVQLYPVDWAWAQQVDEASGRAPPERSENQNAQLLAPAFPHGPHQQRLPSDCCLPTVLQNSVWSTAVHRAQMAQAALTVPAADFHIEHDHPAQCAVSEIAIAAAAAAGRPLK